MLVVGVDCPAWGAWAVCILGWVECPEWVAWVWMVVRLLCLWLGTTGLRWLVALPITEPRIFRDELLHWEMAKAVVAHQPFLLFGQPVETPAVL